MTSSESATQSNELKKVYQSMLQDFAQSKVGGLMSRNNYVRHMDDIWLIMHSSGDKMPDESFSSEVLEGVLKSIKDYQDGKKFYTAKEVDMLLREEL